MQNKVTLNRAVFTQHVFDSSRLTVLTSLFHHFKEDGIYDLIIRRDGVVALRTSICVGGTSCQTQLNIDLAHLAPPEDGYQLNTGGVMGFYVSEGKGGYQVSISHTGKKEKRVVLNNAETLPAGGIFAVTLLRPGAYTISTNQNQRVGRIRLLLPDKAKDKSAYQTEQATTIEIDAKGQLKQKTVEIFTGQSVVFVCNAEVSVKVGFDDDDVKPPIDRKTKYVQRARRHQKPSEHKPPNRGKNRGKKGQD